MNVASLGIKITSDTKEATDALRDLADAADRARNALQSLGFTLTSEFILSSIDDGDDEADDPFMAALREN